MTAEKYKTFSGAIYVHGENNAEETEENMDVMVWRKFCAKS